jgi:hypothetical protein
LTRSFSCCLIAFSCCDAPGCQAWNDGCVCFHRAYEKLSEPILQRRLAAVLLSYLSESPANHALFASRQSQMVDFVTNAPDDGDRDAVRLMFMGMVHSLIV